MGTVLGLDISQVFLQELYQMFTVKIRKVLLFFAYRFRRRRKKPKQKIFLVFTCFVAYFKMSFYRFVFSILKYIFINFINQF